MKRMDKIDTYSLNDFGEIRLAIRFTNEEDYDEFIKILKKTKFKKYARKKPLGYDDWKNILLQYSPYSLAMSGNNRLRFARTISYKERRYIVIKPSQLIIKKEEIIEKHILNNWFGRWVLNNYTPINLEELNGR